MVDIVTRLGKGSPLTNAEVDANFTNLAEVSGITGEPMGHEDRTTSTISFNASTRTFTIAPTASSFTVWCKGKKVVISSAQTLVIPNTTGMHSIYYDANGTLSSKIGYFTFAEEVPTAYVYWNATTGAAPYFGDERHGVVLDWQTHEYLHRTRGAAIANGFLASGYTLNNSATNAATQIAIESGTFFDEDMKIDIVSTATPTAGTYQQNLLFPAKIPVLHLQGTSWVMDAPTDFPFKQGTSRPQYNSLSGGVWSTADVGNNQHATTWILATNNLTYPVIAIIGQSATDNLGEAEAFSFADLTLTGFPSVEFRPLYKLIYKASDGYANSVNARLESIVDLRSISAVGSAANPATDHGNLSGLSDDDHPQYLSVDIVRGSLTAAVKASFLPSQTSNDGKFLQTDGTATSWQALTSGNVTTALGFTPYNATNPSGFITGITSGNVTTALGFTPYNATNPSGYVTAAGARGSISVTGAGSYDSATGVINIVGGVTSFNTRTGAITLSSSDVTTALGFTPYNSTNPNGYLTGITSTQVTTALGYTPYNSSNPSGYITGITSGMVTTALGFTPYNNSNPSGYITSAALSPYLTTASAASTYLALSGGTMSGTITASSGQSRFGNVLVGNGTYKNVITPIDDTNLNILTPSGSVYTTNLLIGSNQVLHAGNYNSYAPTLTGGGASGTWGISVTGSAGSISSNGYTLTTGGSEGVSSGWIGFPNGQGIWSSVNGAHLVPNATGSHGSWRMYGTRGGWYGLHFDSGSTLMMNADTVGFYRENVGWQMRWAAGTGYVHKGAGGGGTEATILDSSNYTSYSPSLSGSYVNINAGGLFSRYSYQGGEISDATTAYTLSPNYGTTTVAMHGSHGYLGGYATTLTMSGYERYGATQISAKYNATTAALAIRNYNQDVGGWNSWVGIISTANYSSYALPLSGGTLTGGITAPVGTFTNDGSSRVLYLKGSGNIIQFCDADGTFRWENVGRNGTYYIYKGYGTSPGYKFQVDDSGNITINNGATTNVSGALQQSGNQVLHAGNINSYIPSWSTGVNASHIVQRDANGYIYANHINFNTGEGENPSINSFITSNGDGWSRKSSLAHVKNSIRGVADGTWGIDISGTAANTDAIDGVGFRNTGSNSGTNADTIESNGITYYTAGVTNFSGNSTDGALYSQAYSSSWQHQIAGDYRSGQIALRGKNSGTWQSWRTVLDSSNYSSYALPLSGGTLTGTLSFTNLYANGSSSYGIMGNNGYFDTVNSGAEGDPLELVYVRGSSVKIGTGSNGSKPLYAVGIYDNGSRVLSQEGASYYQTNTWLQMNGTHGLYWPSYYGAHLHANDISSYGPIAIRGAKNGYHGIAMQSMPQGGGNGHWMSNGNATGYYNETYGWKFIHESGVFSIYSGTYGGGTAYTALHSGNYTSYSPSLGGSGASGTWGISITGNSATVGSKASSTFHQRVHLGTTDSRSSGYYKVRILAATSWMLTFIVRIYQGYQSYDIRICGYNYGGNYWYEPQASLMDSSATTIDVRFGYDSAYNLWVAFPASNYTGLDVVSVVNGYTQFDGNYADQFAIQYESSLSGTVQTTQTTYRPLKYNENAVSATSASTLQGYGPNQTGGGNTIVQRDGNGYIQNSYFYTSGGGSERNSSGISYFAGFNSGDYYFRSYTAQAAASLLSGATMNIAGNAATSTRAAGNFYIDSNYGRGIVGVYSSYRYQGVFAMGDSYKLADDGTTTGSLYGMAWSHPNAGGAAGNLTDHGLLIINNGAFKCAISNSIVASSNITAYSDERLKTNWRDMPENYVARLAQVKVGIYDRTDQEDVTQVGVSAQSFQELLPQAIMTAKDEMQTLSVSYGNAALASAVELAKDNVELRARIERLESLINKLIGD